jgi:hypothetical protein
LLVYAGYAKSVVLRHRELPKLREKRRFGSSGSRQLIHKMLEPSTSEKDYPSTPHAQRAQTVFKLWQETGVESREICAESGLQTDITEGHCP